MAQSIQRMSKWLLIGGGVMALAGIMILIAGLGTSSSIYAQASPTARPPTPAAPAGAAATPARTATPSAPPAAATPARTPTPAAAVRTATPAAPGALPSNGDSVTFPALAIALLGAGLLGLGLFARYATAKSKA